MKLRYLFIFILLAATTAQAQKKELSDFIFRERVAVVPSSITTNHFSFAKFRVLGMSLLDTLSVDQYITLGGLFQNIPLYFCAQKTSWVEIYGTSTKPILRFVSKDDGTASADVTAELLVRNTTNTVTLSRIKAVADGNAVLGSGTYDYYVTKADDHKWYINGVQKLGLPNSGILTTNGISNTGTITSSGNLTSADISADNLTMGGRMTSYVVVAKTRLQAEIYDVGATATITPDKPTSIISGTVTAITLPDIDYTEGDATYNAGSIYTFKRDNYATTITLQTPADAYFESTGLGVDYTWGSIGTYGTLTIQATYHDGIKHWIIISRVDY